MTNSVFDLQNNFDCLQHVFNVINADTKHSLIII